MQRVAGSSGAEILAPQRGIPIGLRFTLYSGSPLRYTFRIGLARRCATRMAEWSGAKRDGLLAAFGVALLIWAWRRAWAVFA